MKHKFLLVWVWFVSLIFRLLPDAPLIMRLKGAALKIGMARAGRDFQVSSGAVLRGIENISVGNNVYIAPGAVIVASEKVIIGDEVMVGFNSVIVSTNHSMKNRSYRFGPRIGGGVVIGNGVWIGANCTVLPDSNIEDSVLLGANSVAMGRLEQGGVYVGAAKKVKTVLGETDSGMKG